MPYSKIKEVKVHLWSNYDVHFVANDDVNVIVGINGSGKTTLLTEIYKLTLNNIDDKNQVVLIPSVDNIVIRDKRRTSNALTQDLEFYIFDMKTGPSMMSYRMSMIDASADKQAAMKVRVEEFCSIVNNLFKETDKRIEIEGNKFNVVSNGQILSVDALSSGEKQILLILLRVFLLDCKESCVLLDEPENSLDIGWQHELINILIRLNPNAQFFITAHSLGLEGARWSNKIIQMKDIATLIK